ncbi:hypothetical protein BY996DRAFT_6495554 [Phakopsora pachyrhizi]|nr:hypothetical protein BY996DRAFT_6495554 [Phakopsora pachyrhizi]
MLKLESCLADGLEDPGLFITQEWLKAGADARQSTGHKVVGLQVREEVEEAWELGKLSQLPSSFVEIVSLLARPNVKRIKFDMQLVVNNFRP